ncbi:MAG: ADP-ribosylglycohydrolase family protein [Acidobacteria bacterium]|nr:ADP-ribosylglycohydrolase family protein [Acidobacteriota bacterium]
MQDLAAKVTGCLLGGAVGDALGAPFEGLWSDTIPDQEELLAGYALYEGFPPGQYTDDTQLTLATVESIVRCGQINLPDIARSIFQLWRTEGVIGPGGACSQASRQYFQTQNWQTCGAPVGNAGNGTAMRTAILGLWFLHHPEHLAPTVAQISQITHHDPRSIAGGVVIAQAARLLSQHPEISPLEFCTSIAETIEPIEASFSRHIRELPRLIHIEDALALESIAWAGMHVPEFDRPIITPFVIPTVLAALWCVLKYGDSWSTAVSAAIKLGGDVDTLGAIVGGLMGAKLGETAIPPHLAQQVVQADHIRALATAYGAHILRKMSREL